MIPIQVLSGLHFALGLKCGCCTGKHGVAMGSCLLVASVQGCQELGIRTPAISPG